MDRQTETYALKPSNIRKAKNWQLKSLLDFGENIALIKMQHYSFILIRVLQVKTLQDTKKYVNKTILLPFMRHVEQIKPVKIQN